MLNYRTHVPGISNYNQLSAISVHVCQLLKAAQNTGVPGITASAVTVDGQQVKNWITGLERSSKR